jgi:excisionase family DNA binding protein
MELLEVNELAELLRLSPNQVVLRAKRGEIPAIQLFGRLRFDANEIQAWLSNHRLREGAGRD